jgi:hypothetical protein
MLGDSVKLSSHSSAYHVYIPLLSLGSEVVPDWTTNLSLAQQGTVDGFVNERSLKSHIFCLIKIIDRKNKILY